MWGHTQEYLGHQLDSGGCLNELAKFAICIAVYIRVDLPCHAGNKVEVLTRYQQLLLRWLVQRVVLLQVNYFQQLGDYRRC